MSTPTAKPAHCDHAPDLRQAASPTSWFCNGCCRWFFGQVTDQHPQIMPPAWKALAAEHNRRKADVATLMLARGQTPPRTSA